MPYNLFMWHMTRIKIILFYSMNTATICRIVNSKIPNKLYKLIMR